MKLIRIAFAAITLAIAALATVQSNPLSGHSSMLDTDPFPQPCPTRTCK